MVSHGALALAGARLLRDRRAHALRPGRRRLPGLDLGRARHRRHARALHRRRRHEDRAGPQRRRRRPAARSSLGEVGVVRKRARPRRARLRPRRALARPHGRRARSRPATPSRSTAIGDGLVLEVARAAEPASAPRLVACRRMPSGPPERSRMTAALIAVAVVVILLLLISASVRVAREYERGVIFRLGRLHSPPKGPGLFLLIPIIDKMVRVDLRTVTLNIPPQEVITKDNVPVRVNAVAYFRIIDPEKAIVQVENFMVATSQIAQTTLRSVLGQHVLDELLVRARQDQRDPPADHRRGHLALGDQGLDRRGQGRRDPERHAARDGAPGRGRARAAREGDRRRGRVPGLRAPEGRGERDEREPDHAPAPLPPDDARDELASARRRSSCRCRSSCSGRSSTSGESER